MSPAESKISRRSLNWALKRCSTLIGPKELIRLESRRAYSSTAGHQSQICDSAKLRKYDNIMIGVRYTDFRNNSYQNTFTMGVFADFCRNYLNVYKILILGLKWNFIQSWKSYSRYIFSAQSIICLFFQSLYEIWLKLRS